MYSFSKRSLEQLKTVNPKLQEIAHLALSLTKVDFGIPPYGGKRTMAQQSRLYDEGKSNADGYDKKSYHQSGNALDFYAFVGGEASWKKSHLSMVANAFLQAANQLGYKLTWGGLWEGFIDYPHVQLEGE